MISSLNSSISALSAFSKKIQVGAHNVANVNTEGFEKSRATLKEGPHGTVRAEIDRPLDPVQSGDPTASDPAPEEKLSNVDLAEEIPQSLLTKRNYQANLKMVQTQDEMMASVLDILA